MEEWKQLFYANYRQSNRQNKLDEICPVTKLFFAPALGVEQGHWCSENCEGLWNFANWKPAWKIKNCTIPKRNMCEFHFELARDATLFTLCWVDELNFTPESNICYDNLSNRRY